VHCALESVHQILTAVLRCKLWYLEWVWTLQDCCLTTSPNNGGHAEVCDGTVTCLPVHGKVVRSVQYAMCICSRITCALWSMWLSFTCYISAVVSVTVCLHILLQCQKCQTVLTLFKTFLAYYLWHLLNLHSYSFRFCLISAYSIQHIDNIMTVFMQ